MIQHWQTVLTETYGLSATLTRLDGEYDLNFAALSSDGTRTIFKVMRPDCPVPLVDMQCAAIAYLQKNAPEIPLPTILPTKSGALFTTANDETGAQRLIWLQTACPGIAYARYKPHTLPLIEQLGHHIGQMDAALARFEHPQLNVDFKWRLPSGDWISDHLNIVTDPSRHARLSAILANFDAQKPALAALPSQAIHNDVNDYNILVENDAVAGLIDFGDMTASPRICNLAIAAAYALLDNPAPQQAIAALTRGYHAANPLTAAEIDLLWPLTEMRLAVSAINASVESAANPNDPYITISQAPTWRLLDRTDLDSALIRAQLRAVCNIAVTTGAEDVHEYLTKTRGQFAPLMGTSLDKTPLGPLSVAAVATPQDPFELPLAKAAKVGEEYGPEMWLGLYGEPRLIYTADAFRQGPWKASDRRTVHLAVDVFAPAQCKLYAPLDATVEVIENRTTHLDYGGVIILRHQTPNGTPFFTLYGHLSPASFAHLSVGDSVAKGTCFCTLGEPHENGGWAPHVHFQLALTTDGMGHDWPGVANPDHMDLWGQLCPNPAALLNLPDDRVAYQQLPRADLIEKRKSNFASNLKLSYDNPALFVRGWKHHLFDEWGRPHLDAYNNVPHVGHAHPRIQAVAADQLKRMNSNTRYLHPAQTAFSDKILSKMPPSLSICYFLNSGSEANELALRLANAHSGGTDLITPNHGYHGNTNAAIAVSAYKFYAKGGIGQPDHVQLVDVPDTYNGTYRDTPDCAEKYAAQVDDALRKTANLSGWISEVFPSVGGQIIPPQGYLAAVYDKIRTAGGVCIADEVQTGLGRLGSHYFAFEQQGVTPDIVVLGKPIGNGHPIGAVITTPEIAASFAQGPEFFSTFGGSTLSCRIGKEVLQIVDDENLQQNALNRGNQLLTGLRILQTKHAIIGDVRGLGLFIGVELVINRNTRAPATDIADYVLNRMHQNRILIGTEGPHDNILKIRPPLTIEPNDIDMILATLDSILGESLCQISQADAGYSLKPQQSKCRCSLLSDPPAVLRTGQSGTSSAPRLYQPTYPQKHCQPPC